MSRFGVLGLPLDLVISLVSWGFHFPVSTYLDQVHDLLREGGRLILDLRKRKDQDTWKYNRVVAIK